MISQRNLAIPAHLQEMLGEAKEALRSANLLEVTEDAVQALILWSQSQRTEGSYRPIARFLRKVVKGTDAERAVEVLLQQVLTPNQPIIGLVEDKLVFIYGDERHTPMLVTQRQPMRAVAGPGETELPLFPEGPKTPIPPATPSFTEQIGISARFARTPLETYNNWRIAFWRELLQNAVDAKPDSIEIGLVGEKNDVTVWITDDGKGMTPQVLTGAFLQLGGTQKGPGATGGFGKAKELILLPWKGWTIKTTAFENNEYVTSVVRGAGVNHEKVVTTTSSTGQTGTTIQISMDPAEAVTLDDLYVSVVRSYVPTVTLTVNGKEVPFDSGPPPGERVQWIASRKPGDTSRIEIQVSKSAIGLERIPVRQNGLYMFDLMSQPKGVDGSVVIECVGAAAQFFTDNRDSFAARYRYQVEMFSEKLSVEGPFALRKGLKPNTRVYDGASLEELEDPIFKKAEESFSRDVGEMIDEQASKERERKTAEKKAAALTKKQAETVVSISQETRQVLSKAAKTKRPVDLVANDSEVQEAVSIVPIREGDELVLSSNVHWIPSTIIRVEYGNIQVPVEFEPESGRMSPYAKTVLHLWSIACRWAGVGLGLSLSKTGVGFMFDWNKDSRSAAAQVPGGFLRNAYGFTGYEEDSLDGDWLVINPVITRATGFNEFGDAITFEHEPRFDLDDDRITLDIAAFAVHEITHAQGYGPHDTAFAYALTRNMVLMPGIAEVLRKELPGIKRRYKAKKKPVTKVKGRDPRLGSPGTVFTRTYKGVTYVIRSTDTNAVQLELMIEPEDLIRPLDLPEDKRHQADQIAHESSTGSLIVWRWYSSISKCASVIRKATLGHTEEKPVNGYDWFGLG